MLTNIWVSSVRGNMLFERYQNIIHIHKTQIQIQIPKTEIQSKAKFWFSSYGETTKSKVKRWGMVFFSVSIRAQYVRWGGHYYAHSETLLLALPEGALRSPWQGGHQLFTSDSVPATSFPFVVTMKHTCSKTLHSSKYITVDDEFSSLFSH